MPDRENDLRREVFQKKLERLGQSEEEFDSPNSLRVHIEDLLKEHGEAPETLNAAVVGDLLLGLDAVNDTEDSVSVSINRKGRNVTHLKSRRRPLPKGGDK